ESVKAKGLTFQLDGDKIKVKAPNEPDYRTKALLEELRRHREELKRILKTAKEEPLSLEAKPTVETLIGSILVENRPSEVDAILEAWREILGLRLDRADVKAHLEGLRRWQRS